MTADAGPMDLREPEAAKTHEPQEPEFDGRPLADRPPARQGPHGCEFFQLAEDGEDDEATDEAEDDANDAHDNFADLEQQPGRGGVQTPANRGYKWADALEEDQLGRTLAWPLESADELNAAEDADLHVADLPWLAPSANTWKCICRYIIDPELGEACEGCGRRQAQAHQGKGRGGRGRGGGRRR